MPLSKDNLYRLPWSLTDNPIGWLEITDKCNMYCKGCYRQNLEGHRPLEELKEEVRLLKRVRNCDGISIAGGEPLIYPDIVEIVRYIREQGIKPLILSNGKALTLDLLRDLKKAGLCGFTFHIDQMQERGDEWQGKNELELLELRNQFIEMMRTVGGGMHMSFGCTVYNDNFQYLPDLVEWAWENSDVVSGLVFIAFRAVPTDDEVQYSAQGKEANAKKIIYTSANRDEITIRSYDIWNQLAERFPGWSSMGYLDGTADHKSIKWLTTNTMLQGKKHIGFVGPKALEFIQAMHHLFKGTYLVYLNKHFATKLFFLLGLFDRDVRRAFWQFLKRAWNPINWFRRLRLVSVGVVQAPDLLPNGDCDMCDSCPDMTFYKGKLYRSCRLDEVRKFGEFLKANVKAADKPEEAAATPAQTEQPQSVEEEVAHANPESNA